MNEGVTMVQRKVRERGLEVREDRFPAWLPQALIVIARIGLGYLFFTQLFWKVPPKFSCPDDFHFTTANANGSLMRASGLCDWIGIESVWANRPHTLLRAGDHIGLPIGELSRINGVFLDRVVIPNIHVFGWLIFGSEAFIFVSMFFGLFTRWGGLVAIGISAQLLIGLAGIGDPDEWEWSYNLIFLLSVLLFTLAPGRIFGIDALLRPRLLAAAARGNPFARFVLLLT